MHFWALGCVQTWCPSTVPWERFLMGTNVNTPFFQEPKSEFGHGAPALDLVPRHWTRHWFPRYSVSEHSTILCRCPGTSRAPSVNTALYWKIINISWEFYYLKSEQDFFCLIPARGNLPIVFLHRVIREPCQTYRTNKFEALANRPTIRFSMLFAFRSLKGQKKIVALVLAIT